MLLRNLSEENTSKRVFWQMKTVELISAERMGELWPSFSETSQQGKKIVGRGEDPHGLDGSIQVCVEDWETSTHLRRDLVGYSCHPRLMRKNDSILQRCF